MMITPMYLLLCLFYVLLNSPVSSDVGHEREYFLTEIFTRNVRVRAITKTYPDRQLYSGKTVGLLEKNVNFV